jgi:hypothetical protein
VRLAYPSASARPRCASRTCPSPSSRRWLSPTTRRRHHRDRQPADRGQTAPAARGMAALARSRVRVDRSRRSELHGCRRGFRRQTRPLRRAPARGQKGRRGGRGLWRRGRRADHPGRSRAADSTKELLREIPPGQGARDGKREDGADPPLNRSDAAEAAGLSERARDDLARACCRARCRSDRKLDDDTLRRAPCRWLDPPRSAVLAAFPHRARCVLAASPCYCNATKRCDTTGIWPVSFDTAMPETRDKS